MEAENLANLKKAILEYNAEESASLARQAIEDGVDPLIVMDALTDAIKQVGDGFGRGDLFLPDLVGAASAMESAAPVVRKEIEKRGKKQESPGRVVIGTVFGDIHTIGKSMVASLLTAEGLEVYDLGIDVPTEKFVEAVRECDPNILAMSALLTTTAPEATKVVDMLKKEGLRDRLKIMVGGGAITEPFAEDIGADGYAPIAPGAVTLARTWLGLP